MSSDNLSANRLNQLVRMNLRQEYAQIFKTYRGQLHDLDPTELLILANAAKTLGRQGVLKAAIDRLREQLGDVPDVMQLYLHYIRMQNDRAAAVSITATVTRAQLGDPTHALVAFCDFLVARHAWAALARIVALYEAEPEGELPAPLYGARALVRLRRRDYPGAIEDARIGAAGAKGNRRVEARMLYARVAQAGQDVETACENYRATLPRLRLPATRVYRAAKAALEAGDNDIAARFLRRSRNEGAAGSGLARLEAWQASVRQRYEEAETAFEQVLEAWSDDTEAILGWLAARQMQQDDPDPLTDIEDLRKRTRTPAVDAIRVVLLQRSGHQAKADDAYQELCRAYPDGQVETWLSAANATLDRLSGTLPGDRPTDAQDPPIIQAQEVPAATESLPSAFQPQWTKGEIRRAIGFVSVLRIQARVVFALLMREIRTRYGRRKLGYLWAFFEPALHASVLYTLWSVRGREAIDSMPLLVFLVTGLVPFFLFRYSYSQVSSSVQGNKALLAHRQVTPFDVMLSRALLEFLTRVAILTVFLAGLSLYGYEITLREPLTLLFTLVLLSVGGVGLGLVTQAAATVFTSINSIMQAVMRLLYFTSGVIFPLSILPRSLQEYALYNPLAHLMQFCRSAFTPLPPLEGVNGAYPTMFLAGVLLFGLLLNTAMQRRILEA
jgi:capsular polysaccharide transport system permease protein